MQLWMVIQGVGVLLGLVGLVGVALVLRRAKKSEMPGGKKAGLIAGSVVLMLVGGFLVVDATAIAPVPAPTTGDGAQVAPQPADDFDAPL